MRVTRAILIALSVVLLSVPFAASAVGTMADAMCDIVIPTCKCMTVPDGKGNCIGGMNKFMCPPGICIDNTNGFNVPGTCVAPGKCEAKSTSDGKLDQGMSKLGEMLGKLMEALKGKDGGGGGSPTDPNTGQCITMQPTGDRTLSDSNPMCYFYNPASDPNSKENQTDPSGGLVADPTSGETPLKVTFAFTNGTAGCNTPQLVLDYADGEKYDVQVHSEDGCRALQETVEHTFSAAGDFAVRLKVASTGDVRGGVNLSITAGANPQPNTNNPNECVGGSTGTGGSASACGGNGTGGSNGTTNNVSVTGVSSATGGSNASAPLFTTPLTNLGNTGSVGNKGTGSSYATGGSLTGLSASTGGTNENAGASLNLTSPQSIVQSIIQKNLPPGAYGDVKILSNGTTIIAGVREGKTEVAGFFGTNSTTGGQSAVAKMCVSRPWSKNFLSYIIPPSFFDSLCTWRGYTVGGSTTATTATQPKTTTTQPAVVKTTVGGTKQPPKATTTTEVPNDVKVDIWASPTTVPLGARTSVFWNTQGVIDCIETSPDGSFTQSTLKGGASTVPLTAPTTFTISCIAPNGSHVTDSVTVQIAL